MDARITKSRLANFLAYDWLKILFTALAAIGLLALLFTTIATDPRDDQMYDVYVYENLEGGEDALTMGDVLLSKKVFSYDILTANAETFSGNPYAAAAFNARRAAGTGRALFIADTPPEEEGGRTGFEQFVDNYTVGTESDPVFEMLFSADVLFEETGEYLAGVFGEDWRAGGPLLEGAAERCFSARNSADKRFKTEEQRQEGIKLEERRLQKLRDDLLFVEQAFSEGVLSYRAVTTSYGEELNVGIKLRGLSKLSKLCYYAETEGDTKKQTTDNVILAFFNNGSGSDLDYESVSFLRYLVEAYK